jgi:hypothetical protein
MVEVSRLGGSQEGDLLSQRSAKYRPHRLHRHECSDMQDFLVGGIVAGFRPQTGIPPADRPLGNEPFCGVFLSTLVIAVGAVDTFPSFTDGLWPLSVYPSAGATSMHLASDYIHPYKDAGGRSARCRVRIFLPDDLHDAPEVIYSELPNNPGGSITKSAETIAAGVIQANSMRLHRWP